MFARRAEHLKCKRGGYCLDPRKCRDPGGPRPPPPQILSDQLTLSQPGGGRLCPTGFSDFPTVLIRGGVGIEVVGAWFFTIFWCESSQWFSWSGFNWQWLWLWGINIGNAKLAWILPTGSVMANCFFFKLAMTGRNMQPRYFLKMVLKSWDLRNFASTNSFHEMHTVRHLQCNLQIYLGP